MISVRHLTLLACGAALLGHPLLGDTATTLAEPLVKIIGEIAEKASPSARDYSRIAEATLDFGRRKLQTKERPQKEVIESGLDAVDAGEKLNTKAAEWPRLREELKNLLENDEDQPSEPPPPNDPSQNQDQNKENQDNQKDQDGSDQQKSSRTDDQSDQRSDQKQKGDSSQKQNDERSPQENSQQQEGSEANDQTQGTDQRNASSAFGDMKESSPPPTSPQTPTDSTETQKVGGQSTKETSREDIEDPQLVIPLQKLDQLRNQDSPAKLFRMMEGPPSSTPAKKGKDW